MPTTKEYYLYAMRVEKTDGQVSHYNEVTDDLTDVLKDTLPVKGGSKYTVVMCLPIYPAEYRRLKKLFEED